jgi:hypothetical protein
MLAARVVAEGRSHPYLRLAEKLLVAQLARQDACTPRSGDRQITNALSNKTATTSFAVASLLTLFPDEHHPN